MPGMMFNVIRKASDLKPNPFNVMIYGEEELDNDLLESIKLKGLLEPIVIKDDGIIISGHRRWAALKKLGMDANCRTITFDNELDEKECLIEFNRQRKKTSRQCMKESEELEIIEREKAKLRQIEGGRNGNISQHSKIKGKKNKNIKTSANANKSRTIIAEKIGMKRDSYEKTREVWDKAKKGDEVARRVFEKLAAGDITAHAAYCIVRIGEKAEAGNEKAVQLFKKVNSGDVTPNEAIKELKKEDVIRFKGIDTWDTDIGNVDVVHNEETDEYSIKIPECIKANFSIGDKLKCHFFNDTGIMQVSFKK